MSVLLEILKSATPVERQEAAEMLKPYLAVEEKPQKPLRFLSTKEFKARLPRQKNEAWIRDVLLEREPILKQWVYGLHGGKGVKVRFDPAAVDWVLEHRHEIDWSG